MKFKVTFKDPDALDEQVRIEVNKDLQGLGLDDDEVEAVFELRCEKVHNKIEKWFQYGEYLTVEIDTDAGTCTVLENK